MYLGAFGVVLGIFVFCSFWIYHYVDLEGDTDETNEDDIVHKPIHSATQTTDSEHNWVRNAFVSE